MPPRNYRNSTRRSRMPTLILGGLGLFALASVGIVGTLWLAGVPLNPFADREPVEAPFMVRIPINSQAIPAYSRVDRRQLMNPSDGGLMFQKIPPQATVGMSIVGVDQNGSHVESRVESIKNVDDEVVFVVSGGAEVRQGQTFSLGGAIMNINAIIGRVVKADKRAGMGFQESTFFPQGTPEGLAGATPHGMRAITLDATRLTGVHSLGAGDLIDLLASVPMGDDSSSKPATASEVQLLAQNAKVLRPVYVRNEVSSSASLMNGKTMQNVPKYEVAIAVAADDVIPLQNALNQELPITCVAHSMKPESENDGSLMTARVDEVRVPVTVRPILAYAVVSRDAFVSPATRAVKTETISRQEADRIGAITSINEALGAIVRQDIPAGRYLRHSDLLKGPPEDQKEESVWSKTEGSTVVRSLDETQFVSTLQQPALDAPSAAAVGDRPAISSFIPPGMRAFAIPFDSLLGSEHLQIGDKIDLMVSYAITKNKKETITTPGETRVLERELERSRETERGFEETFAYRGEPWFVAMEAVVIGPLGFPAPAPANRQLQELEENSKDGAKSHIKLGRPPIMIAVSNLDAENVAAALVTENPLFSFSIYGEERIRPGMKRVAIVPGKLTRLDAFDEAVYLTNRRGPMYRYVSNNDPRFAGAIESSEIGFYYGRVLTRTKQRWEVLREDDFFPAGITAGLAAKLQPCNSVLVVSPQEIESLGNFEEGDSLSILLRDVSSISNDVIYSGLSRNRPWSEVVVDNAWIIRVDTAAIALEMHNSDVSVLQAALAYVKSSGTNSRNDSGSDRREKRETGQGSGRDDPRDKNSGDRGTSNSVASLVAVVRPRTNAALNHPLILNSSVGQPRIPNFDSTDSLRFMDVIVGRNRDTYAFDRE
ncbi:hypothetical protein [Novipirellula caenicola]|uniref:SAF domain-containing protein n=1 Tax=Novipirellula caenicola TaxID=1536901 RepID=A0ABP9VJP7_9BACT